jgi:hypothetical protein
MEFNAEELAGLEPREAGAYVKQFVTEATKYWSFYEPYDDLDMSDAGLKERSHALLESRLSEMTDFFVDNYFGADDDARTFEEHTGVPFEELSDDGGDNTYNWSWLYPSDLNFKNYSTPDGQKILEIRIHLGGDVRGNYGGGYYKIFAGDEEDESMQYIYDLTQGSMSVNMKFSDGSSISFSGEQASDIESYEVANVAGYDTKQPGLFNPDEGNAEGGIAYAVEEAFSGFRKGGRGYEGDEFVNEIVED